MATQVSVMYVSGLLIRYTKRNMYVEIVEVEKKRGFLESRLLPVTAST